MKCKSWSNKLNNFVVRKLKAFKINGQPQVLCSSTMPTMPKELPPSLPLNENHYSEMKMKEHLVDAITNKLIVNRNNGQHVCGCGTASAAKTKTSSQSKSTPSTSASSSSSSPSSSTTTITAAAITTTTTTSCTISSNFNLSNNSSMAIVNSNQKINEIECNHINGASSNGIDDIDSIKMSETNDDTNDENNQLQTTNNSGDSCWRKTKIIQNRNNRTNKTFNGDSNVIKMQITPPALSTIPQITVQAQLDSTTATTVSTPANDEEANTTASAALSPAKPTNNATAITSPEAANNVQNGGTRTPTRRTANDFYFGRYIGEGSFSTVYLARDVHNGKEYAIKVCDKQHILRERKQEYVRREREVMHVVNNVPGFVNLSCTFQDYRSLYFVMTYAKNGDLLPYINKVGSFDLDCTRHYAAELVLACENMHKRGIVHRDLKPENILLDENMHTLIADFGSAKILNESNNATMVMRNNVANNDETNANDTANNRRRRGSFVGTAQYVSPEVLQNGTISRSADLWALGCIIYQMISGLPPFRGNTDYFIFKEILNCNLTFPDGFDKDAEDLVRKLLRLNAEERIGAQDKCGHYESIRTHPFFDLINWDIVRTQTPPPIYPYLPGVSKEEELRSQYRVPDNLEPGLDDKQLTRLLGLELGTSIGDIQLTQHKTVPKKNFVLTDEEKKKYLEIQKVDKWHQFADNEVILKKGFVNKRKGLFARKRMLLLTTGPRLIYIDPVQMVKKGEIPWSENLRVEPKNFKIFFVHTPNRTYYLEDPEGYALEWVEAVDNVRNKTYEDVSEA